MSAGQFYQAGQNYHFGRAYEVSASAPGSTLATVWGNIADKQSPLRCKFSIERDLKPMANKATVELTNLNNKHRATLTKGATMSVSAGYRGKTALLFYGKADKVVNGREDADIMTALELKDADDVLRYATIDKTYKGSVKLVTLIADILGAMRVQIGQDVGNVTAGIMVALPNKTYNRVHLTGTCADNLKTLLAPFNMDWSVQNGRLFVAPKDQPLSTRVEVVSERTGLVSIPSAVKDAVTMQTLLNPNIVPGGLLQLISNNSSLSGLYKARKVKYSGDTHGQEWTCDIEAVPYSPTTGVIARSTGPDIAAAEQP